MKKTLAVICFACLILGQLLAQTCASPFAMGSVTYHETCNPSGVAPPYTIHVTATSDSTLDFVQLWEVPVTVISADVDCNTQTFAIARQPLSVSFDIQGQGTLSGQTIAVTYGIYDTGTNTLRDSCTGYYLTTAVGNLKPQASAYCELYPNPAQDRTVLMLKGVQEQDAWAYHVVDVQGREVAQGDLGADLSASIEVATLSPGVYRIVARNRAGEMVSKALVVE